METEEYQPRRTSAPPVTIEGVTFECWKTARFTTRWKSSDGRAEISRNFDRSTHWANVDGNSIGANFRSLEGAMKAAANVLQPKSKHAIRYRDRVQSSPPRGMRQSWGEYQVVEGRKIVGRFDLLSQARKEYPDAVAEASAAGGT